MKLNHSIMALLLGMSISTMAMASIDIYEFDSPQQEAQYRGLIEEFRCPKCQNQNLAGSDAPIAQDLKQKTYEMVKDGRSDTEIRNYMFERYGDFISYKPPVRPSTWILWFFPPVLLVLLILGWIYKARKGRSQLSADDTQALSSSEEAKLAKILAQHGDKTDDKQQY
ncbi:cytochrome c-type biogenesis protein [uncultured Moraxella sp.]|uniref:cytochrome c-type biogenesis protein n=1 Tax=uncultured Moraxella sp. TaxID=263769 RepID=UPI0025F27905|nr:cytochrome c-type biogenesis protein [uncultured Moraxella sp.]